MKPSNEQEKAITIVRNDNNLLMSAGAGTGKSTTLRLIAENNPDKNFLCIVYNAANAKEGNEHPDKPENVMYKTGHSLAYGKIVTASMRKKLDYRKGGGSIQYNDIDENIFEQEGIIEYDLPQADRRHAIAYLRKAMVNALQTYCLSDTFSLIEYCTPLYESWFARDEAFVADEMGGVIRQKRLQLNEEQQLKLAEITRKHWFKVIDESSSLGMSHDVYLKLFALQKLSISSVYDSASRSTFEVDVLCLDEAQDTNLVMLQIFNSFLGQKVVVGDAAQQLYAWRGAINAMSTFAKLGYETGYLTTSYRFNSTIADSANIVLRAMDMGYQLTGLGAKQNAESNAYLFRSNAGAIRTIFDIYTQDQNARIYSNANIEQATSKMWHMLACLAGKQPTFPDKSLSHVKTQQDAIEAMELSPELETIVRTAKLIESKAGSLKAGLDMLKNKLVANSKNADYVISTIHKAKGLEWDIVTIGNDLIPNLAKLEDTESDIALWYLGQFASDFNNMCVLYVAITRARIQCNLPPYLIGVTEQKLRDAILFFAENPNFIKERNEAGA